MAATVLRATVLKPVQTGLSVDAQRPRADEFGQFARRAAPRQIHLEVAVLRMQKAGGARDVLPRGGADGRDPEGVPRDGHGTLEAVRV